MRGAGDAYALRKAYHDDKVNDQFRPPSPEGAAMFEAAEQARVEAIGALAMKGVAAQSRRRAGAAPDAARPGQGARRSDEAPLADVLGLMVREKLTGEKPPASLAARRRSVAALHRGASAGTDLAKLAGALRDQKAFAAPHPHHPQAIWRSATTTDDESGDDECAKAKIAEGQNEEGERTGRQQQGESADDRIRRSRRRGRRGSRSRNAAPSRPKTWPTPTEPEDGMQAAAATKQPFAHQDEWGYKIYTAAIRRGDRRRRSLRRRRTGAAAQFPRPAACRPCRAWSRAWPTSCSAC